MPAGLYGKLIAKRDFIAVDLPAGFLQKWEPWLQGMVTAANLRLGARWQQIFFTAPLWRFWLGAEVLGMPVIGVLMPSMDGVGRQFPLVLVTTAPEGQVFLPLADEPQSSWFGAAEDFLLSTLDDGVAFEATLAALAALPAPRSLPVPDEPETINRVNGAIVSWTRSPDRSEDPLSGLTIGRLKADDNAWSVWWTIGGETYPPTAMAVKGLPDEAQFLRLLASPVRPQAPIVDAPVTQEVAAASVIAEQDKAVEGEPVAVSPEADVTRS